MLIRCALVSLQLALVVLLTCYTLVVDLLYDIRLTVPRKCYRVVQEAQLSLRDRATRACQLKSGKVLHKCRRLVFEKL